MLEDPTQLAELNGLMKRGNKYGAVRTTINGITFDSKKEAARYSTLRLLELAGEISCLSCQPKLECKVHGHLICVYIPDFSYLKACKTVYEDVKSKATKTPAYRIKKKLVKAIYDIDIQEV